MSHQLPPPHTPPSPAPAAGHAVTWPQIIFTFAMFVLVQLFGMNYYMGKAEGKNEQSERAWLDAVARLTTSLDKLTTETNGLSASYSRVDEHIRGLDRRVDKLEGADIKEWKRPQ